MLKTTTTFIGKNGLGGFLTGEVYFLELDRAKDSNGNFLLEISREKGKNFHDVSSESVLLLETESEFFENFKPEEYIDFSEIFPPAKKKKREE